MPFRLTVIDAFSITGRGTVATGRVEGGPVRVMDRVALTRPDGTRAETIVMAIMLAGRRSVRVAEPGTEVGLILRGISRDGLRGAVIAAPGSGPGPDPIPDPEPVPPPVQALDALDLSRGGATDAPALLLPLRIETAFRGDVLLVRAFPDQVHVDAHDPALSADEVALGQAYLDARRGAGGAEAATRALRAALGGPRARHVAALAEAGALREGNSAATAARIRALPERLLVEAGLGDRRFAAAGATIAADLALDPAADPAGDWTIDFDTAARAGMALRLQLDADAARDGLDWLVVVGLRGDDGGGAELSDLLEAQARSAGVHLPAAMSPAKAAHDTDAAPVWPGTDARRDMLEAALGRDLRLPVDPVAGADPAPLARDLALVTWFGLLRPALIDGHGLDDPAALDTLRRIWIDRVAPFGPLPTLAIGRQPYGIALVDAPGATGVAGAPYRLAPALAARAELAREGARGRGGYAAMADTLSRQPVGQGWHLRRGLDSADLVGLVIGADPGPETTRVARGIAETLARAGQTANRLGFPRRGDDPLPIFEGRAIRVCGPLVAEGAERPGPARVGDDGLARLLEDGGFWRRRLAAIREGDRAPAWDPRDRGDAEAPPEPVLRLIAENAVLQALSEAALAAGIGPAEARAALAPGADRQRAREAWNPRQAIAAEAEARLGAGGLADLAARLPRRAGPGGVSGADLAALAEALARIDAAPAHSVHLALAAAIDTLTHRLDAWAVALAGERLAARRAAGVDGLALGGWAVLEDIRPAAAPPRARHLVAPSERLARIAALLDRARLGLAAAGLDGVIGGDLSGEAVAAVRPLLQGLGEGREPGAVLAALVAEDLSARGASAAIRDLAARFPLSDAPPSGVVGFDGIAFAAGDLSHLAGPGDPVADAVRAAQATAGARLDALADVLVAEGAAMLSDRRPDAALGALSGLSVGGRPPDAPAVIDPATRATSLDFAVAMAATDRAEVDGDDLGRIHPRLSRIACAAMGPVAGHAIFGPILRPRRVALARAGLTPLALARLCGPGRDPEAEVAATLAARLAQEDGPVRFDAEARATFWAAQRLAVALDEARPLGPGDLPPEAGLAPSDAAAAREALAMRRAWEELRADLARAAVPDPVVIDPHVFDPQPFDPNPFQPTPFDSRPPVPSRGARARRIAASRAHVLGLIPRPDPDLLAQAGEAVDGRLARADAVADPVARMAALMDDLPVPAPLAATETGAFSAGPGLVGATPADLSLWLEELQLVRPRLGALADLKIGAVDPGLVALQWPTDGSAGEPWIGGPRGEAPPVARTSVVVAGDLAGLRPGEAFGGLLIDRWQEALPKPQVTLGVSVEADIPPARAPQAILLAPAPPGAAWDARSLADTVRHAFDLARGRMTTFDDLADAAGDDPTGLLAGLGGLVPLGGLADEDTTFTRAACPPGRQRQD